MTGRFLTLAAAATLAASLGGCATPVPVVRSSGTLPGAGSYGYGEGGAPPAAAAPVLTDRLARQGLTASDNPRYLIQSEYSRPPARSGTLIADQPAPAWQRAPVKGARTVSHLSLSVTEIATGTEVYRSAAWQRTRGKADDSALLMQAALNPPPAPATPAR